MQALGPDPLDSEIQDALAFVLAGGAPPERESRRVDFKEEANRRDHTGQVMPGEAQSEAAAHHLAQEAACMANTAGGGALIVGFANDGTLIGTALEAEWLRHRIYELTDRQVTADVRQGVHDGRRILVLRLVEALSPVAVNGRMTWRVDDHCVPVDLASWWAGRLHRLGHDWSAEPSNYNVAAVRPSALQRARDYLRASEEDSAIELAEATDADLLRRLNVLTSDGLLTNAGAVLFVGREAPAIDYIRRDSPGDDSRIRLREGGHALLEELRDVEQAIAAANPVVHIESGLSVGQIQQLPRLAVREAIVNGVVHRDWASPAPTTVEHTGSSLVVTSPGGFVGSVTPANIITHPSEPRYRALAEAMASLRVAEREGVGVDRMVREMIRVGYRPPLLEEVAGPYVRAALVGGRVDEEWLVFLASITPNTTGRDLDVLLLLRRLVDHAWVDEHAAQVVTQRNQLESIAAIERLEESRLPPGVPVIVRVAGTPNSSPSAWRFSDPARDRLADRLAPITGPIGRLTLAMNWAHRRGRVSTTELADLVGVAVNAASASLRALEEDGALMPSRENRTGAGFHYLPTPDR